MEKVRKKYPAAFYMLVLRIPVIGGEPENNGQRWWGQE